LFSERTYSSLQIGKFPFAYRGLKIIPDFQQAVKILSRRAVEPFEVGLTKQLLCVVDPNAGRIGELLIRRSNYKFREIQ
jgi:hypothetical protein